MTFQWHQVPRLPECRSFHFVNAKVKAHVSVKDVALCVLWDGRIRSIDIDLSSMSSWASEWASEWTIKWCEQTVQWTSEWPSGYVLISGLSEPLCSVQRARLKIGIHQFSLLILKSLNKKKETTVACPPFLSLLAMKKRTGDSAVKPNHHVPIRFRKTYWAWLLVESLEKWNGTDSFGWWLLSILSVSICIFIEKF